MDMNFDCPASVRRRWFLGANSHELTLNRTIFSFKVSSVSSFTMHTSGEKEGNTLESS